MTNKTEVKDRYWMLRQTHGNPFEKMRKSLFVAVGAKRFTNFANSIRDKGK